MRWGLDALRRVGAQAGPALRSPFGLGLGLLLAAAVALRAWTMVAYWPAVLTENAHDGACYVRAAHGGLGRCGAEPSGYPLFLRLAHAVSDHLAFAIGVQHVLGLAAGVLVLLAVRAAGAPLWLGLLPAAVVWLNGDQLFLEHAPLSESLFTVVVAAAVFAAIRSQGAASLAWPILAGALAVSALAVRTVALPLPALLVVVIGLASWRMGLRWRRTVAATAAAALVAAGAYAGLRHHATGRFSVVVEGSGAILYGRAAEFADCHKFTPPAGTAILCESTPPSRRPGSPYYVDEGGPALTHFGRTIRQDPRVGRFARAAIRHQPLDFLKLAAVEAVHYVDADVPPTRASDYVGPSAVTFASGPPELDPDTVAEVGAFYAPARLSSGASGAGLHSYQSIFRLNGWAVLAALVLGLIGAFVAAGRVRWAIVLLLAVSLQLVLAPTLIHAEWRYVVPAEGEIVAAAALGGWALLSRARAGRGAS